MADDVAFHPSSASTSPPPVAAGGRAMQLISIDADGKCHVQPEAKSLLERLPGKVAVVGIAGIYRTGKSFLLNRLLGQQQGFEIGPTVNACTKGLWMWDTPVQLEGGVSCLFVDTEGLGSAQRTASCDMQIFSLCILLSSYFVYNCMGAIDEQAIDDLHLVLHLAKHIHARSGGDESTGEHIRREELSEYFPGLLWVVRDFHLKLVEEGGTPISEKAYLENALKPLPAQDDKNKLRETIKELFRDRDCVTLVRPVAGEENLRRVNELPYEELREPFRRQVEAFVQKVYRSAKPKEVNGTLCSGSMLSTLAEEYCAAINNSVVPNIQSAWTSVVQQQLRQCLNEALQAYRTEMQRLQLPMNEDQLRDAHKAAKAQAVVVFTQPKFHEDEPRLPEFREDLLQRIKQQYEQVKAENQASSARQCKEVAQKLYGQMIEAKLQKRGYANLEELLKDWAELRDRFKVMTSGPSQADVLGNWIFQRMSESCTRVSDYLHVEQVEKVEVEVESGMYYKGQWRGDHRHGHGLLRRPDGSSYEGTFVESRAHGYGTYMDRSGNRYEGQWQRDQTHGFGKYVQAGGGAVYEGEWNQNQKSGRGIEIWPDGAKYEGSYLANCKHGAGTYTTGEPLSTYDGQFNNDEMDGEGRFLASDGCQLTGQWRKGHMSGKGQALWPDGSKYVGGYEKDVKNGEGAFFWPDGRVYRGQWLNGKQSGVGVLIDHAGLETRGTWQDGNPVAAESSSVGNFTGNLSKVQSRRAAPATSSDPFLLVRPRTEAAKESSVSVDVTVEAPHSTAAPPGASDRPDPTHPKSSNPEQWKDVKGQGDGCIIF